MKETIDDRRYRMQMEEKARREGMEAESKRKNDEYNAALESGDVSPEVEAELTRSQAEKDMDDSMLKAVPLNVGGMPNDPMKVKYNEGSMLVAPEMGLEDEMPVDTYDNIPEDEKETAEASQLPDDEMEEDYTSYVLEESLDMEEQEYLMGVLESDERLSGIFDKVMDIAGEFSGEGEVEGLGTGVSDSIPARLSDGEFVFTKKATDQMGADQLQTMMDEAEKAYDGGLMKKAFGGMIDDTPEMEESKEDEEINSMMIASNQMPSVRPR
jgi:hypothetical protein